MNTTPNSSKRIVLALGSLLAATVMLFGHPQNVSAQWGTNGTSVYYNGGNVGIGTSTPNISGVGSALTLNGNSDFIVEWAVGGARKGNVYHTGTDMQLFNNANGVLKFGTNNNERMRIDAGGNVGIGTTSPGGRLDVQRGDGSDLLVRAWNSATSSGAAIFRAAASSGAAEAARLELADSTGYNGGISGDHNSGLVFRTGNQSATYSSMGMRMVITPSGNVGIGTAGPLTTTHVAGGSSTYAGELGTFLITGGTSAKRLAFGVDSSATMYSWIQSVENGIAQKALALNPSGGKVGIGTTTPGYKLDVNGEINATGLRINGTPISTGSPSQWSNNGTGSIYYNSGNVGIGTTNPSATLFVTRGTAGSGTAVFEGSTHASHFNYSTAEDTYIRGGKTGAAVYINDSHSGSVYIGTGGGNVGIGTASPTAKLHVVGDGKLTGNLTVDGNIAAKYQDVAEWVESSQALAAGTVVVLDQTKSNQVIASSVSYDTRVAGVISLRPGIALGENGAGKVLVATTGRVRIKVDASHGSIKIGDLLVTSDLAGVAMKSQPIDVGGVQIHRPGTLIGKALEPLEKGTGEVLVLLSLQ